MTTPATKASDDILELSRWGTPPYPPGTRWMQHETEVVVQRSDRAWRIHNRVAHPLRRILWFTAFMLVVATGAWALFIHLGRTGPAGFWKWVAVGLLVVTLVIANGLTYLQYRSMRGLPSLLAWGIDGRIEDSIDPALIGGILKAVVCRVGRKTDPEHKAGVEIVQLTAIVDTERGRVVRALWTFERTLTRPLESRLRTALHGSIIEVIAAEGIPSLVSQSEV